MGKKKRSRELSSCCHAKIRINLSPDFIGDNSTNQIMGTCYYICTKCNQPCSVYIPIRRTWTRNPATKVKGDEREKKEIKLTKKEIEEIRRNEDF